MWQWREDTGTARESRPGGWRLDAYGTWVWDPSVRLDPPGARPEARVERLRPAMAALPPRPRESGLPEPAPRSDRLDGWEPTPIFRSVASEADRARERRLRLVESGPAIPEPHPGSGPLPVQRPEDAHRPARRGLAPVETVPPPPHESEPTDPQDELRQRAERRRRPRQEAGVGSGRHAMRSAPADDRGRHAFR